MDISKTDAVDEQALRALLCRVRQSHLQAGIDRLIHLAKRSAGALAVSQREALRLVYLRARQRVIGRLMRQRNPITPASYRRWKSLYEQLIPTSASSGLPDFHCDAALGGLARWLRAAGYDAVYWPGIDDNDLIRRVQLQPAIMLTTDSLLMQRGVIRWGALAARHVSIGLKKHEQFAALVRCLSLPIRPPRCMACGGVLTAVKKETVKDRIPPRTFLWINDYFTCARCGRLFWKGTHWAKIESVLNQAVSLVAQGSPSDDR